MDSSPSRCLFWSRKQICRRVVTKERLTKWRYSRNRIIINVIKDRGLIYSSFLNSDMLIILILSKKSKLIKLSLKSGVIVLSRYLTQKDLINKCYDTRSFHSV